MTRKQHSGEFKEKVCEEFKRDSLTTLSNKRKERRKE